MVIVEMWRWRGDGYSGDGGVMVIVEMWRWRGDGYSGDVKMEG